VCVCACVHVCVRACVRGERCVRCGLSEHVVGRVCVWKGGGGRSESGGTQPGPCTRTTSLAPRPSHHVLVAPAAGPPSHHGARLPGGDLPAAAAAAAKAGARLEAAGAPAPLGARESERQRATRGWVGGGGVTMGALALPRLPQHGMRRGAAAGRCRPGAAAVLRWRCRGCAARPSPSLSSNRPSPSLSFNRPSPSLSSNRPSPSLSSNRPSPSLSSNRPSPSLSSDRRP
jgi:hypothetical protein